MPSLRTTPVAGRVEFDVSDAVYRLAAEQSVTVSRVVGELLSQGRPRDSRDQPPPDKPRGRSAAELPLVRGATALRPVF